MGFPRPFCWGGWPCPHGDHQAVLEREDDSHLAGQQHFFIHISALPDGDLMALRWDSSSDLGRCFQLSLEEGFYGKSLMEQNSSEKDGLNEMNPVVQPWAWAWAWQGAAIYFLDTFPWRSLWHDPELSKASFTAWTEATTGDIHQHNPGGSLLQVGSVICQDHC